jgi:signal transduction histidine kinase
MVHPDDREYVDRSWKAALGGEPYDIEHRIQGEGAERWVRERAELEFDADGNLLGGFGTAQDITEQVVARRELEEARRTAERRTRELASANKELESFSYSVSHDLRSPLRAVITFSDVLLEDFSNTLGQDGRAYVGRIKQAGLRMDALIDDLLSLSRVSRQEMRVEEVDLAERARDYPFDHDSRARDPAYGNLSASLGRE